MAKQCYVTGRKASTGNKRSHALNSTKRRWNANLQKVRILVDGKPKKVWVSARALKSCLLYTSLLILYFASRLRIIKTPP